MAHRPFGDFSQQQDRPPSDLHRDIFDTRLDPRVPTQDQEVSISSTYFYLKVLQNRSTNILI